MAHNIEDPVRRVAGIDRQCHAPSAKTITTVARQILFEMQFEPLLASIAKDKH